jgi:D-3-phosphoglycerate dehydrogenase
VVVADKMHASGFASVDAAEDCTAVSVVGDPDRLEVAVSKADALVVRSATKVTESLMAKAPNLRVIGRAGIGVDNIDLDAATRRGIAVLNVPGGNTVSAAEHTVALLLALVRQIPWAAQSMKAGEWDRSSFGGTELRGKTLGLIGLGRIGMHVASIASAFGMTVLAYDPFLPKAAAKKARVNLGELEEVLAAADVVSLHAPLTDDTRHVINERRLKLMKSDAVVINAARGGLIDADALVAAIEAGEIAGAALDVFDPEPLPADSPLRTCDRVILTPHLAASTIEAQARVSVEICKSVMHALRTGDIGGALNVAGVSAEALRRAGSPMDLAKHLGRLAGCIVDQPITAVEVSYAGEYEEAAKPVMLSALEGVLQAMKQHPVSIVNAAILAEEHGITVSRRIRRAGQGGAVTIDVQVKGADRKVKVEGILATISNGPGRVTRIDDYEVDLPAAGAVVIMRNKDVPGVIGRVGTLLGESGVNIAFYHQSRSEKNGGIALAAIAVDMLPSEDVLNVLKEDEDVMDVRLAQLDAPIVE